MRENSLFGALKKISLLSQDLRDSFLQEVSNYGPPR